MQLNEKYNNMEEMKKVMNERMEQMDEMRKQLNETMDFVNNNNKALQQTIGEIKTNIQEQSDQATAAISSLKTHADVVKEVQDKKVEQLMAENGQ